MQQQDLIPTLLITLRAALTRHNIKVTLGEVTTVDITAIEQELMRHLGIHPNEPRFEFRQGYKSEPGLAELAETMKDLYGTQGMKALAHRLQLGQLPPTKVDREVPILVMQLLKPEDWGLLMADIAIHQADALTASGEAGCRDLSQFIIPKGYTFDPAEALREKFRRPELLEQVAEFYGVSPATREWRDGGMRTARRIVAYLHSRDLLPELVSTIGHVSAPGST